MKFYAFNNNTRSENKAALLGYSVLGIGDDGVPVNAYWIVQQVIERFPEADSRRHFPQLQGVGAKTALDAENMFKSVLGEDFAGWVL